MENRNTIKVKVNGQDKPIKDMGASNKETKAKDEAKEFTWVLPEPPKLQASQTNSVFKKQTKDHFKKQMPQNPAHIKRLVSTNKKRKVKHKKTPHQKTPHRNFQRRKSQSWNRQFPAIFKKQWAPALSAVVVGIMMGMLVLSIFSDGEAKEVSSNEGVTNHSGQASIEQNAATENLDLNILQGAVFSSKSHAKKTVNELRNQGYPAVLDQQGDRVHLFIGAATKKSQAEKLGKMYRQNGQEVYVKAFRAHPDENQINKKNRSFFDNTLTLLKMMIQGSSQGLASNQAALTDPEQHKLKQTYQKWKKEADAQKQTTSLTDEIEKAYQKLNKDTKHPDTKLKWQAQKHLMQAAIQYKKITNS